MTKISRLIKQNSVLLGAAATLTAGVAFAALPAQELVSAPDPLDVRHSGHDVATYGGFTIASSQFESSANLPVGDLQYSGRLRLFNGTNFVRNYPLPVLCAGDFSGAGKKNTIAIGASGIVAGMPTSSCEGATYAGAALVYERSGNDYSEGYTVLAPPQAESGAEYGDSVATHGDWIAVGAPGLGKVDLWKKQNGSWSRQGWLPTPASLPAQSNFGQDVAIHGGFMVVGAPSEQKFYVYENTHSGWVLNSESSDTVATGTSVDISNNMLVSSGGWTHGSTVLVYRLHWDGTWIPMQEITHDVYAGMPFGSDVAISDHRLIIGNDIEQRVAIFGLQGNYVHLGDMLVNLPTASGVYEFLSFGSSVDIDGDDVVAGDHDARYQSSTTVRGAVFQQKFYHVY